MSVLAARRRLADRRFALLMGDHLFEPPVLSRSVAVKLGSLLGHEDAVAA